MRPGITYSAGGRARICYLPFPSTDAPCTCSPNTGDSRGHRKHPLVHRRFTWSRSGPLTKTASWTKTSSIERHHGVCGSAQKRSIVSRSFTFPVRPLLERQPKPLLYSPAMGSSKGKGPGVPSKVIREGGYQPTSDPGPIPTSLIRPAAQKPSGPSSKPSGSGKS